jgi:pilus assembly protein Flp/PilA
MCWPVDRLLRIAQAIRSLGNAGHQGQLTLKRRNLKMKNTLLKLYTKAQILREDCGQDLIEYALVVALIAFAAIVGMGTVANGINGAFTNIAAKLNTSVTP